MRCATTSLYAAGIVFAGPLLAGTAAGATVPQCGMASWYEFTGQTASGEAALPGGFTAAHQTLPFDTRVTVENLINGRTVEVRINDRGPHTGDRIIDITRAAAEAIRLVDAGVSRAGVALAGETQTARSCR